MTINRFPIAVSIILPVYNVAPYIRQCLDSLVHQTLRHIEIILINDCSTDGSEEICEEYAAKDNRIKLIHNEENSKQGFSRNRGIEAAQGEYIGFVDPDDWIDLNFFEKLYQRAVAKNLDIVKTKVTKHYPNGKIQKQNQQNKAIQSGLRKKLPFYLLFTYEYWSAIYRSSLIKERNIRFPNLRNAEDLIFLLRITFWANSMQVIQGGAYHYRIRENSTVSVKKKEYFFSFIEYAKLYIDFINNQPIDPEYYTICFQNTIRQLSKRYEEMDIHISDPSEKSDYVSAVFDLLIQYKYNNKHILNNIFPELECRIIIPQCFKRFMKKISGI